MSVTLAPSTRVPAPLRDALAEFGRPVNGHRPVPRLMLDREGWQALARRLAATPSWALIGLWGEPARIHAALLDEADGATAVVSLDCPEGRFPSLGGVRPGAIRLERAAQDLFGLTADGLADPRPWLDHGVWPRRRPLSAAPEPPAEPVPYTFLPVEGEGLHQVPVGPVHAGIIEPGHFRFTCNGEAVVRLEQRLGYVHKGIEGLMRGKPVAAAAKLAARVSGDSTVAHSLAFARAVEAAAGIEPPPRAVWLRALMAELERLANHVGDFGAICNDAAFGFMLAQCALLREQVLRVAGDCFGHRLMMDGIVPGGVARDLTDIGRQRIAVVAGEMKRRVPELARIYADKTSLMDRTVGTGRVSAALVRSFAVGGFVGRASGRAIDVRRLPGYPPYDQLTFTVATAAAGDVDARIGVRLQEIGSSLDIIEQVLDLLPAGPLAVPVEPRAGEGLALVEGFRGDILCWVALDADGTVLRCHPRDPSWFQWPLLEAAIEGNIIADFPLCNKSFNCSYSGQDL